MTTPSLPLLLQVVARLVLLLLLLFLVETAAGCAGWISKMI